MHPPKKYVKKGLKEDHYLRIDSGPFKGIEFVFTHIAIHEDPEADRGKVVFGYDIFGSPNRKRVNPKRFHETLANILNQILLKLADETDVETTEPKELTDTPTLNIDTSPDEFSPHEIVTDV